MADRYDVLIIGGGLVGSSIAWRLTQEGKASVAVLDVDLAGHFSSSELNAGLCRTLWSTPLNSEMAYRSVEFYETIREEINFKQRGILWLHRRENWGPVEAALDMQRRLGLATQTEVIGVDEIRQRYPEVDNLESVHLATVSPRDAMLNANALKNYYRSRARAGGARFYDRHHVTGVTVGSNGTVGVKANVFETGEESEGVIGKTLTSNRSPANCREQHFTASLLVNATGAWAGRVASLWEEDLPAGPARRQVSLGHSKEIAFGRCGVVISPDGLYCRPEAGHVLAGYSPEEEPSSFMFKYDGGCFFAREIHPRLMGLMSGFEKTRHMGGWAGLYGVTPDLNGLLGRSPQHPSIFHACCFTGRGVVSSYAVGLAAAELLLNGQTSRFQLAGAAPDRFQNDHPPGTPERLVL